MTRILIAGIGNIFLGDDAFGTVVTRRLAQRAWPEGVRVADFGLRCLELAYTLLDDWEAAIVVDAAAAGAAPGTLYRIALGEDGSLPGPASDGANVDNHSLTIDQVWRLALRLGTQIPGRVPPITLIGCQPQSLEPSFDSGGDDGLSPPVAAAVPGAIAMISELVAAWTTSPPLEVTAP